MVLSCVCFTLGLDGHKNGYTSIHLFFKGYTTAAVHATQRAALPLPPKSLAVHSSHFQDV